MGLKNFLNTSLKSCASFCGKFTGYNTVLYFVPHQDDELLTMGIDICAALTNKKDVHVILCTDGSKSRVILKLKNQEECDLHSGKHIYNLSESEFSRARDAEFKESCLALGVLEENIHILPQRAVDGLLTAEFAEEVIRKYLQLYGRQSTVCAIYHGNGETQHRDHKALGFAVANLFLKGLIRKVRFFCEPYHTSNTKEKFIIKHAAKNLRPQLDKAFKAYSYWNPEQKRYAIGYHSVTEKLNNWHRDMMSYYFKMKRF